MNRYRTLEQYLETNHFKDGLNACDRFLKKSQDPLLLLYKARFHHGLGQPDEAQAVFKALTSGNPKGLDVSLLEDVDNFLWEFNRDAYPQSLGNGADANILWANLTNSTPRGRQPELYKERFTHAITQQRWADAGLALTNWRKIEPDRTDLRFVHAAIYEIIAEISNDPMTVRMNSQLSLRTLQTLMREPKLKASELRLMVIIFQRNKSLSDLAALHEILKTSRRDDALTAVMLLEAQKETQDWSGLRELSDMLLDPSEERVNGSLEAHSIDVDDWRIWECRLLAEHMLSPDVPINTDRMEILKCRSRTTQLANMWVALRAKNWTELKNKIRSYYMEFRTRPSCYSEIRQYMLALPSDLQTALRDEVRNDSRLDHKEVRSDTHKMPEWLSEEAFSLRVDYLLSIGQLEHPDTKSIYAFINNVVRLQALASHKLGRSLFGIPELLVTAVMRLHDADPSEDHMVLALTALIEMKDTSPTSLILIAHLCTRLGLYQMALSWFRKLSLKEVQLDTVAHTGLTRISIGFPQGKIPEQGANTARSLLTIALDMYKPSMNMISDDQSVAIDDERFDLILQLEDVRKSMSHSISRRIMILELRRLNRLSAQVPETKFRLHPATEETWTKDVRDNRDFDTCDSHDAYDSTNNLERKLLDGGAIPDADWVRYQLWIDEICSLSLGASLLTTPFLDPKDATASIAGSPAFTQAEKLTVPLWKALASASTNIFAPTEAQKLYSPALKPETAITQLCDVLDALKLDNFIPANATSHLLPSSSTVQALLLHIDFILAVRNFAEAIDKKRKTLGVKVPQKLHDRLSQSSAAQFQALRRYAQERKNALSSVKLEESIVRSWTKVLGSNGEGRHGALSEEVEEETLRPEAMARHAEPLLRAARETWDSILQIRFGG